MNTIFRQSDYIDFNTGTVKIAPMELQQSLRAADRRPESLVLFECRVEVWQLGVAVQMLREMECPGRPPCSIWSHAAYGLIAVAFSYFEMIGKSLNPQSRKANTAKADFNFGFCDVYPDYVPHSSRYSDPEVPVVAALRDRVRNGMYHLAYTKKNLIIHHDPRISSKDFDFKPDRGDTSGVYFLDPHLMIRSIVDHFPTFIRRLRDTDERFRPMQTKFDEFVSEFHTP